MSAQSGTTYGDRFVFTASAGGSPLSPGLTLHAGFGSPEGVVIGYQGDIYFRKDGGAASPAEWLYVKASGEGTDTGWIVLA
jgi:hypothetical protein